MKPRLMHALKWTISIGAIVGVALPIARTPAGSDRTAPVPRYRPRRSRRLPIMPIAGTCT